jgi:hypothetical protein
VELISAASAAQQLNISERSLRQLAKHEQITEVKLNARLRRYRQDQIDALKNGATSKPANAPTKAGK